MKYILIILLAVLALVLIKIKCKYRIHITVGFLLIVIFLNIAYNLYAMDSIMSFIKPVNQLTYQPEYLEKKEFPDALLPLILKNKTVNIKEDRIYDIESVERMKYNWMYGFFHCRATRYYLQGIGSDFIADENINDVQISKNILPDFIDLGYANDMYRNTNMYSGYEFEDLNYFGHYWYFNTKIAPMHIYINPDGLYAADELVWLWQPISVTHDRTEKEKEVECYDETEYMFIMSKDYFYKIF